MSFQGVLDKYRQISISQRDKGERFERLMQAYLQTEPMYSNKFEYVWMWSEFPQKGDFGGKDIGIDLVCLTYEGEYWAVQCKCFQEKSLIAKGDVDSFLATSSKSFSNSKHEIVQFSHRLWISTTNHWGLNAVEAIKNQSPPVSRLNLTELEQAAIDWDKLDKGLTGGDARTTKKTLFEHQEKAIKLVHDGFQSADRGKMIMACGTGKTFTSLRIAENETDSNGLVLFLVPSIALLGQTLREWSSDAEYPITPVCICSDPRITRKTTKYEDSILTSVLDLALPASTDVDKIGVQLSQARANNEPGLTVVFSTYQSIEVIAEAQRKLSAKLMEEIAFDLIICDEAHRTTGVALTPEDSSAWIKVHRNDFILASKRLYMTATPRLYSDDAKSKAAQADAVLCSMDDVAIYGEELYRIGFGEAVEHDLLTDYKVLILTLSDKDISPEMQNAIASPAGEISADDATKLIGCVNALSKKVIGDDGSLKGSDPEPMKRAVAFCPRIKDSKSITKAMNRTTDAYLNTMVDATRKEMVQVSARHIDGTMAAPERDELLGWLKSTSADTGECRVLNNVRCLSEGVDVPSLDAVMFLSARNSQVDVVQSVGRVMRRAPGKNYGYIIIPVVIPFDVEPEIALNDNERFKVVWTVLNALRAHDDRFNATVNRISLMKKSKGKEKINVVGIGEKRPGYDSEDSQFSGLGEQIAIQFEKLQSSVFAKLVQKVGDRVYWEKWAKDVALIATRQIERITSLVEEDQDHQREFDDFLEGLHSNINPSITQAQAIEMLSQHIVTKPVFEALFDGYSFVKNNPVSIAMQGMLRLLEDRTLEKDSETLQRFFDSVKKRAEGIDNAEGRQRIIIELYDKFFKTAFPRMVEQLGIVYTPVEVVDFIIQSVNDVLKREFGRDLGSENVHILDPFTGTGTFITRILQSGLISQDALKHKFLHELHANEIVLLAYYIAAVNIENAYHDLSSDQNYSTFDGICLTDTFQLGENESDRELFSEMFPQNSARVSKQKKAPLTVILGNPPYSKGQKSANDNAPNQNYEKLDNSISESYAHKTNAANKNALYNPYLKAFRWSTDRLDENGGIISFVTDGGWLENSSMNGFRLTIEQEFSSIYIFNLRGDQRTSGELSRREGGKIFGSGSRSPIAITLLVKNPKQKQVKAKIFYHDIGDYLDQPQKLGIVKNFASFASKEMPLQALVTNEEGDWLNHRSDIYSSFIPLVPDKKFNRRAESYFVLNSLGILTSRDAWLYNHSFSRVKNKSKSIVDYYNIQVTKYLKAKARDKDLKADNFVDRNPRKISWSSSLLPNLKRGKNAQYEVENIREAIYRPFNKQYLYYGDKMIHRMGQFEQLFPVDKSNTLIGVSGIAGSKINSTFILNSLADINVLDASTQYLPLYYYQKNEANIPELFRDDDNGEYIRKDGVSDFILSHARDLYGTDSVDKEDLFYYVYGFLHGGDYRASFANDLKKVFPRLPLVEDVRDFWKFSRSGRALADIHINYEKVPAYKGVTISGEASNFFLVEKMRFPSKQKHDTIHYNSRITISNIPDKAYEYVVNGKSAIEWIMERYQVTTNKASGIKNDPNDWSKEVGNPRYILDLLLSIINVSVQTVEIVDGLPKLDFENL